MTIQPRHNGATAHANERPRVYRNRNSVSLNERLAMPCLPAVLVRCFSQFEASVNAQLACVKKRSVTFSVI